MEFCEFSSAHAERKVTRNVERDSTSARFDEALEPLAELGTGLPVGLELLGARGGQRVVEHLAENLRRHRRDLAAELGRRDHVLGVADRGGDDLRGDAAGPEAVDDLLDDAVESTEMSSRRPMKHET